MAEKNPYARKGALRTEDIKPDLKVVVVGGGRAHHEVVIFKSKPYPVTSEVVDTPHMRRHPRGDVKFVEKTVMKVRVVSCGKAVSTEITSRGDGASRDIEERFLSEMGFCSDPDSGWSGRYTVPLNGYRPQDHE